MKDHKQKPVKLVARLEANQAEESYICSFVLSTPFGYFTLSHAQAVVRTTVRRR